MKPVEIILKDLEIVRAFIDKLDGQMLKMQNWALLTVSATVGFSFTQQEKWLLLGNVFVVLSFFIFEMIRKSFHEDALKRASALEKLIPEYYSNKNGALPKGYKFGLSVVVTPIEFKRLFFLALNKKRRHILFFYLGLSLFSLLSFLGIWLIGPKIDSSPVYLIDTFRSDCVRETVIE